MKKSKMLDSYKHDTLVLDLDEKGRMFVTDEWFTKIITFHQEAKPVEIEKCLIALGFKKED